MGAAQYFFASPGGHNVDAGSRWLNGLGCVRRLAGRKCQLDETRKLALASGALSFAILLSPLVEMDRTRQDNPAGMGLAVVVFLIILAWRVSKYTSLS